MTVLDLVLKEVLVGVNQYTRQRSHHTKLVVVAMKAGWDLKYAKAGAEQVPFMKVIVETWNGKWLENWTRMKFVAKSASLV